MFKYFMTSNYLFSDYSDRNPFFYSLYEILVIDLYNKSMIFLMTFDK